MQGLRICDRFGFNLPQNSGGKTIQSPLLTDYNEFIYDLHKTDWIETNSDKGLSNYEPDEWIDNILKNCMDLEKD